MADITKNRSIFKMTKTFTFLAKIQTAV